MSKFKQIGELHLNLMKIQKTCISLITKIIIRKDFIMEMFNPPHPGEILKDLYMADYKLSVTALALKIGICRKHLSNIINCKAPISTEVALKLAKAFGTSAQVWLNEQVAYDLWQAKQHVNLDNVEVIAL